MIGSKFRINLQTDVSWSHGHITGHWTCYDSLLPTAPKTEPILNDIFVPTIAPITRPASASVELIEILESEESFINDSFIWSETEFTTLTTSTLFNSESTASTTTTVPTTTSTGPTTTVTTTATSTSFPITTNNLLQPSSKDCIVEIISTKKLCDKGSSWKTEQAALKWPRYARFDEIKTATVYLDAWDTAAFYDGYVEGAGLGGGVYISKESHDTPACDEFSKHYMCRDSNFEFESTLAPTTTSMSTTTMSTTTQLNMFNVFDQFEETFLQMAAYDVYEGFHSFSFNSCAFFGAKGATQLLSFSTSI